MCPLEKRPKGEEDQRHGPALTITSCEQSTLRGAVVANALKRGVCSGQRANRVSLVKQLTCAREAGRRGVARG